MESASGGETEAFGYFETLVENGRDDCRDDEIRGFGQNLVFAWITTVMAPDAIARH